MVGVAVHVTFLAADSAQEPLAITTAVNQYFKFSPIEREGEVAVLFVITVGGANNIPRLLFGKKTTIALHYDNFCECSTHISSERVFSARTAVGRSNTECKDWSVKILWWMITWKFLPSALRTPVHDKRRMDYKDSFHAANRYRSDEHVALIGLTSQKYYLAVTGRPVLFVFLHRCVRRCMHTSTV